MRTTSDKVDSLKPSGIRKFFDLVIGCDDIISLGVGEPDFVTPWHITESAIYSLEKGYTSYTSNWGLLDLRKAISQNIEKKYQASYNPDSEILVTVGVSEGIDITFRTLLNPGDEVIIPTPCYVCYEPLTTLAGGVPVIINTAQDQFSLTREKLLNAITDKTKVILLSYPNNPTGVTLDKQLLQDIIDIAIEKDLWIVSDEVYAELIYDMQPMSAASYNKENVILLSGLSKSHAMTGWRIGYIAGPEELMVKIVKIHQYNALCAPIMSQYAALEAYTNGDKEVEKMRKSFELRRNFFYNTLVEMGFDVVKPNGAFYIFPSIQKFGLSANDFAIQLLQEKKVAVVPGDAFGEGLEGYIRCCYATSMEELKEALKRIQEFTQKLGN